MPELPEVEVIARLLNARLSNLTIVSFRIVHPHVLREADITNIIPILGQRVREVHRRAKYVLVKTERELSLVFHLKMTGQFVFCRSQDPWDKHTHFGLTFANSPLEMRFRDVRKFGFVSCIGSGKNGVVVALNKLGPEPLEIEREHFVRLFHGRKARLKSLLLDQTFVAGIGNIYADEILFKARLHPALSAAHLSEEELSRVWAAMTCILRGAISQGGSSIRNFVDTDGREGSYQKQHQVYGRSGMPCPVCSRPIHRLRLGGRSSYVCPSCQEPPGPDFAEKIPE